MNKLIKFGWLDWFSLFLSVCRFCFVLQYPWWSNVVVVMTRWRQLGWCVCLSDVYLPALQYTVFALFLYFAYSSTFPFFKQFKAMRADDDSCMMMQRSPLSFSSTRTHDWIDSIHNDQSCIPYDVFKDGTTKNTRKYSNNNNIIIIFYLFFDFILLWHVNVEWITWRVKKQLTHNNNNNNANNANANNNQHKRNTDVAEDKRDSNNTNTGIR